MILYSFHKWNHPTIWDFFFLRLVLFIYLCCLFFFFTMYPIFILFLTLKQTFDTICNDYLADVETQKLLFVHLSSRWYTIFEIWTFIIQNNRSLIFMVSENASAKTDIPKFSTLKWNVCVLLRSIYFLFNSVGNQIPCGDSGIRAPSI